MTTSTKLSPTSKRQYAAALAEKCARRAGGTGPDLLTWTITHRAMLKPGLQFDLRSHPYLTGIYQCQAREQIWYKASQLGLSEAAVSYVIHACDQRQATVLYVFPTDKTVSDFSTARIGPAIEASPYLASIVVEGGGKDGKRGADRVTLKRIRDRFLYLRGGIVDPQGNAPQLKSIDADVLVIDEVDEVDPRAIQMGRKRLGHSQLAEVRLISTPTYAGMGIHAEWLQSDQRLWHIKCNACGEWQPLSVNQLVTEWDTLGRPVRWNGQADDDAARAWLGCRKCGAKLDRLQNGQWVQSYRDRDVAGFHITKLFSPTYRLDALISALQSVDESKRKETFNQDLGEPYTPRGGQLGDETLDACRREFSFGLPVGEPPIVMGIDVGRVLHCVIRSGPTETGECRLIWAEEAEGWARAADLIRQFKPSTVVIDGLPETTKARELQAQFERGKVWLAYYVDLTRHEVAHRWDEADGIVHLDRTRTLDDMYAKFWGQINTMPTFARDLPDYYPQLKSLVRVLDRDARGNAVAKYVESAADHYAHAENYCAVAFKAVRGIGVYL